MKKLLSTLLIALCIGVAGCKKDTLVLDPSKAAESLSASKSLDATAASIEKFGVLPNNLSWDDKVTVAKKLKVKYVRDAIVLRTFNGRSGLTDKYIDNGFKILLNLNYDDQDIVKGTKEPHAFPTDMIKYKQLVNEVFDNYKPEIAVIENEPFNDNHYKGPIENYLTELSTAVDICKKRGIKVADGGLNPQRVCILVYQDYVKKGMQKQADDFAKRALIDKNLRIARGKGSADGKAKLEETRTMVEAYKTIDLDYVTLHWYEPLKDNSDPSVSAPGVLQEVADYLRSATGKKVITNEFGQNNEKASLVRSMVDALRVAGFLYAIDFSGEGASGSVSLTNGTKLKSNGEAYRDKVNE
jgi:hypothetical protein